jgi:hypothetical protein
MIKVLFELMISECRIQPLISHLILILAIQLHSQSAIVRSHRSFKSCIVDGLTVRLILLEIVHRKVSLLQKLLIEPDFVVPRAVICSQIILI